MTAGIPLWVYIVVIVFGAVASALGVLLDEGWWDK